MKYEAVIGLEVHAQLKTKSKIFCGCSTQFGAEPNTQICPVCTGMPGVLPVLNKVAIEYIIKTSLALDCKVNPLSRFARKQYFYPDLPKNYQISQYDQPVSEHGYLDVQVDGKTKRLGITRIHLEEDAGKLLHEVGSRQIDGSYVDLNRTGVPLMEIVSEPDMRTPQEAHAYLIALKSILEYLDVSDCNMEEGSLRCDANVSIRPVGQKEFGTKAEVKNMNSFKGVQKALEYEIARQIKVTEEGERIVQETRLWDADKEMTFSMRSKEEAHDYRYFPEPDLVPVVVDEKWLAAIKATLPELSSQKKERFVKEYSLPEYDAGVLTADKNLSEYFEATIKGYANPKAASNWIMTELLAQLNAANKTIKESLITPKHMREMLELIDKGTISGKIAKTVFEEMFASGKMPDVVVKEKGLVQISDEGAIAKIIEEVLAANAKSVEEYKAGKTAALNFLLGQVMKKTQGKANPGVVNKILKDKLS